MTLCKNARRMKKMTQNNSYELQLSIQNETIVSNLDVLKQALDTNFNKYSKVVYVVEDMDKQTYDELKATRAKLNKLYKTFDDERKRVCESNKKLITQCKKEVDDSISILKNGADNLSKYIMEYELLQKHKALRFAEKTYKEVTSEDKYSSLNIPFGRFIVDDLTQPSKLANKESKLKEYFTIQLNKVLQDFNTIDTLDNHYDKAYLKALYLNRANLDLNTTIKLYQDEVYLRDTISKQIDTKTSENTPQVEQNEELLERTFTVTGTVTQLTMLSAFMNKNNIKFKKINQ